MARSLGFPSVPHEHLPHAPLQTMLGQVQFPLTSRVADLARLAPFQEAIAEAFPQMVQEQLLTINFGPEGVRSPGATPTMRFISADGAWNVALTPSMLTLEATALRYSGYADFRERFQQVWEAAREHLSLTRRTQIGLRYINHIQKELSASEWGEWIRSEILGVQALPEAGDRVQTSMSDVRFALNDGLLAFKHGIVQAGPDGNWGYLLDFDYFSQQPVEDASTDEVLARFDAFHDEIYAFFRWTVTERSLKEFSDAQ